MKTLKLPHVLRCVRLLALVVVATLTSVSGIGCGTQSAAIATPTTISISPASSSVLLGQSVTFTATVSAAPALSTGVLWQINGVTGGSSTAGTISAAGLYTAPAVMPAGATAIVTAVAEADTTKSATANVTLLPLPISVSVAPLTASVLLGATQAFTASLINDVSSKGVLWQVNGVTGGSSAVGTISASGVYTAPVVMPSSATVTVTAVSQADSTKAASAIVALLELPISVGVAPSSATVQVLLTQQFAATLQNDLSARGVVWDIDGVAGGNSTVGTVSAAGLYTAPANVPTPATVTLTARSVADTSKSAAVSVTIVPGPQSTADLDRIDFGNTVSEAAHNFQGGNNSPQTEGTGAFAQTYRQPQLVVWPYAPVSAGEHLTFTMTVSPMLQNYITVKLYGSDTEFGVLKVLQFGTVTPASGGTPAVANSPAGDTDQLDNNVSNGPNNPPAYGLFHYATLAIPQSLTIGKTSVTLTLYSTGYYYSFGGPADAPTRPVYSAFTHTNPYFVPSATDPTGTPLTVTGYTAPVAFTQSQVDMWKIDNRGTIFEPGNQGNFDGFFEPGGILEHEGICPLPAGTPGAPPEVMGLSVSNLSYNGNNLNIQPAGGQPLYGPPVACQINPAAVAAINATASPADTWRNVFGAGGDGNQSASLDTELGVYLLAPLVVNGATMKGYDDYHDPNLLALIVGELDGLTRMYNAGGGFSSGCISDFNSQWAGFTTTPRTTGLWAGATTRQNPGCISFDGGNIGIINTTILRLLSDPAAAPLFKAYLAAPFDANLDNNPQPRAYAYERMGYFSQDQMFFNPVLASTSNNYFDKANITTTQALIAQQGAYSGQLMLRALLALYPNADPAAQPLDPGLMKSIIRELIGLDIPIVLDPLNTDWRTITAAGLGESHGTLSSGYDGRYGNYEAPGTGNMVYLSQWDTSLNATDRQQFKTVPLNCISAYDHFLYPQQYVGYNSTGVASAIWTFAQEDVISYRVPYGPNADGGSDTWFVQVNAADPNGPIQSPYALRSFYFSAQQSGGFDALSYGISTYPLVESLWTSLVGLPPSNFPALPGEPGQPDFAWADLQDGAVSIQYQGERLMFNAQYNRPDGGYNNLVRLHYITPTLDRQATVMMPYDATTAQNDGNLSGNASGPWIIRYGKYLVVLNNTTATYTATLPAGTGSVALIEAQTTVPMGSSQVVPANSYEVFVLPQ